jgi:hypothetical protein
MVYFSWNNNSSMGAADIKERTTPAGAFASWRNGHLLIHAGLILIVGH